MGLGGEFFWIGLEAEGYGGAMGFAAPTDAFAAQEVEHGETRKAVVARPGGNIDATSDQVGVYLFRGAHQLYRDGFAGDFYFFAWHVVDNVTK